MTVQFRIGQFVIDEPRAVQLVVRHIAGSGYSDYFATRRWPKAGLPIRPFHLWRANHLGAGWQIEHVRRFMDAAAQGADRLLRHLPSDRPQSPDRAKWFGDLVDIVSPVRGVDAARLTKALHPLAPLHVPIVDRKALPWAVGEWFQDGDWADMSWTQVFRLLDRSWAREAVTLDSVVRKVKELAPERLVSPFGVLD